MADQMAFGQPGEMSHNHILLLCNSTGLRSQLAESLRQAGYRVTQKAQSAQVLVQLTDHLCDVLVLDLDTVQSDPVAFMKAVRRLQPGLQLVILTQHPTLRTAITAIRVGTVDYFIMPTDTAVIVQAVQRAYQLAINWRLGKHSLPQADYQDTDVLNDLQLSDEDESLVLVVPPARLDFSRREAVLLDDPKRVVELSRGETDILASLMRTPDQPLRAEQIARAAWKYSLHPFEAGELVRPYIFRLRRKLEAFPEEPKLILTLRGRGYLFASSNYSPPLPL